MEEQGIKPINATMMNSASMNEAAMEKTMAPSSMDAAPMDSDDSMAMHYEMRGPLAEKEDVVICGGGLAGLTLALQLRRRMPKALITLVEPTMRPLPEACFKVGESIVEVATDYFQYEVGVHNLLKERHLPKLGLRFFLGDGRHDISVRDELGLSVFPPYKSYQLDRGRFESDLRDEAEKRGVLFLEGAKVKAFDIHPGDDRHMVEIIDKDGVRHETACRWFVDASGRKRMLQRQLGLAVNEVGHHVSSTWFRLRGRITPSDFSAGAKKFDTRTVEDRWYSTNHLCGDGYWIWMIPVVSGYTSIGVVVDEDTHPDIKPSKCISSIMPLLEKYEPDFAKIVAGSEQCDIGALRNFSYTTRQAFSADRWACVGEAAAFADPLYSPGSDMIGFTNTMTAELICRDLKGEGVDEHLVDIYNEFLLEGYYPATLAITKSAYGAFGDAKAFFRKQVWDDALYWGTTTQIFVQKAIFHPEILPEVTRFLKKIRRLQSRVQPFFAEWARRSTHTPKGRFFDISTMPFLQLMLLDLKTQKSPQELLQTLRKNYDRYEEAANALFFEAVGDVMPEKLKMFGVEWVNVEAISLDPTRWSQDGLFNSPTQPRDLKTMRQTMFGGLSAPSPKGVQLRKALHRGLMRVWSGKLFYAIMDFAASKIETQQWRLSRGFFIKEQPSRIQPYHIKSAPAE